MKIRRLCAWLAALYLERASCKDVDVPSAYKQTNLSVWPEPVDLQWTADGGSVCVSTALPVVWRGACDDSQKQQTAGCIDLRDYWARLHSSLFSLPPGTPSRSRPRALSAAIADAPPCRTPLEVLTVAVDADTPLGPGMDEGYGLSASGAAAKLTAATTWGAMRGLETFAQLLIWRGPDADAGGGGGGGGFVLAGLPLTVRDAPAHGHRGLLIDTARHYLPPRELEAVLDAMASLKVGGPLRAPEGV